MTRSHEPRAATIESVEWSHGCNCLVFVRMGCGHTYQGPWPPPDTYLTDDTIHAWGGRIILCPGRDIILQGGIT